VHIDPEPSKEQYRIRQGANFFSGAGNAAQNPRCMQPRIGRIVSGTFGRPERPI